MIGLKKKMNKREIIKSLGGNEIKEGLFQIKNKEYNLYFDFRNYYNEKKDLNVCRVYAFDNNNKSIDIEKCKEFIMFRNILDGKKHKTLDRFK